MSLRIYLSGKIKKAHEKNDGFFWGEPELGQLSQVFSPHSIDYLDPSNRSDDLSDSISVFGRDLLQVYLSTLVLADLREQRGIGVGGEMIFAGWLKIPVVSVAADSSFYRPRNAQILNQHIPSWIHPFVSGPSTYVAPSVSEAAQWVKKTILPKKEKFHPNKRLPDLSTMPSLFLSPMQQYIKRQLDNDLPMKHLINKNKDLEVIVEEIYKKTTD